MLEGCDSSSVWVHSLCPSALHKAVPAKHTGPWDRVWLWEEQMEETAEGSWGGWVRGGKLRSGTKEPERTFCPCELNSIPIEIALGKNE